MIGNNIGIKWAAALTLAMGICGAKALETPTTQSTATSKPKVDPGTVAVADAVKVLRKEYADFLKNQVANKLRDKSNYFTNIASMKDVTDAAILAALSRSQGGSGTEDAYVKWQLLSALTAAMGKDQERQIYSAYVNAPAVPPNPGMDRTRLDRYAMGLGSGGQTKTADVGGQLQTKITQYKAFADPILKYRDALFALLPNDDLGTAEAGLSDVYNRAVAGADITSLTAQLMPVLQSCSTKPGVSAGGLRQCAAALRKIKAYIDIPTNQPYNNVAYDTTQNRLVWTGVPVTPDTNPLEQEAQALLQAANNPPPALSGGLIH